MITTFTSEWNIDFASENLEVSKEEIVDTDTTYCKYDSELNYTYEPDVLDTLPPATSALYGSDSEHGIQESATKFPEISEVEDHGSDGDHEWSETNPSSPSHESIDSSFESQVSTPQASPRRHEEEPRRVTSRPRKIKVEREIKEREVKDRKKDSKAVETRTKTGRAAKHSPQPAHHHDNISSGEANHANPSRIALPTPTVGRTRTASPLPDEADDPQGLFLRDPSTLTPEELKQLKKRKRLIKNRESAQLSRQRKRIRLETLQAEVMHLEGENKALHARVDQLAEENATLKRKLLLATATAATATAAAPAATPLLSFPVGSQCKTRAAAAAAAAASTATAVM